MLCIGMNLEPDERPLRKLVPPWDSSMKKYEIRVGGSALISWPCKEYVG